MADNKIKLNHVESCKLGKLGADGVALQIKFAMDAAKIKEGPHRIAVFGMSRHVAQGLARALTALLDAPARTKPTRN